MKPFISTALFALVVVVVVGVAYLDFQRGREQESAKEIKDRIFPELEGSRLDRVVFHNGRQTLEFQAKEGEWSLHRPLFDKGDDAEIDRFLMNLLRQDVYVVEVDKEVNWSQYGLEKPQGYFRLRTREGGEYQVEISRISSFDGRYYLRKQNRLFIGHRFWGDLVKKEFDDFRDKRLLEEETKVISIQFVIRESESFQLDLQEGVWRESHGEEIESRRVKAFVKNQLVGAEITHFVEEDKKELSKYKLDKPFGKLSMKWDRGGGSVDEPLVVEWSFTDPSKGQVFLVSSVKTGIYRVSPVLARQWIKAPADFKEEKEETEEEKKEKQGQKEELDERRVADKETGEEKQGKKEEEEETGEEKKEIQKQKRQEKKKERGVENVR